MDVPDDLRYSVDHEWVRVEGDVVRIGITDYAQDALGDVVFVDLPLVGAAVEAGDSLSEIESTKAVSDVYAPVDGDVVEANAALVDTPELLNRDPYGDGWICLLRPSVAAALPDLLDAPAYRTLIEG